MGLDADEGGTSKLSQLKKFNTERSSLNVKLMKIYKVFILVALQILFSKNIVKL